MNSECRNSEQWAVNSGERRANDILPARLLMDCETWPSDGLRYLLHPQPLDRPDDIIESLRIRLLRFWVDAFLRSLIYFHIFVQRLASFQAFSARSATSKGRIQR
jgi:hypothetical protein